MWAAGSSPVSGTLVTAAVTLLVGVFGGGTLVALFRVNADRGKVIIETAQGAVIVQTGVMAELRAELNRLKTELEQLREDRDTEVAELRAEVGRLRADQAATATRVDRVERDGGGNGHA